MNIPMLRRMTVLLLAISLLSAFYGCTRKSDVSGKWSGTMTLEQGGKPVTDLEFDLVQKGGDLSGAMIFTKLEGGKIALKGTRANDEVTFATEIKKGFTMNFTGAVKSGTTIQGTARLSYFDPKVPVKEDKVTLELTRK